MNRLRFTAACLAALSTSGPAISQVKPPPRPMMCPKPDYQTIAPASPSGVQSQFRALEWGLPRAALNETMQNKIFLHTFQWRDEGCCQVMAATVTIRLRALTAATSRASSDAGNDTMRLFHNGVATSEVTGFVWPLGTPAGTVVTRNIPLTAATLALMNSNNMIRVAVQDDTAVEAVQVQLNRCCLTKR